MIFLLLVTKFGLGTVEYEFDDRDFLPFKSSGEFLGHHHQIHADDLQNETLEAVPNMEEALANNERKERTEIKKNGEGHEEKEPEGVRIMEEVEDFLAYEFDDRDFLPFESFRESLGYHHQILLNPQESSKKECRCSATNADT